MHLLPFFFFEGVGVGLASFIQHNCLVDISILGHVLVQTFLLLNMTPLYMDDTWAQNPYLWWVSRLLQYLVRTLKSLYDRRAFSSPGNVFRNGIPHQYDRYSLHFHRNHKLFSKVAVSHILSPAECKSPSCSTSSPRRGMISLFHFSHSSGISEVLNCIFIITNDARHLFRFLYSVTLVNCPLKWVAPLFGYCDYEHRPTTDSFQHPNITVAFSFILVCCVCVCLCV